MVTSRVSPWFAWLGLTQVMVGVTWLIVKMLVLVAMPPGVVTETSLAPALAELLIVILALIWLELFTVKLLTVVPEPRLTAVTPVK